MSWSHAGPGIQRSASHWSASHWSNAWQTWHIRTCKQKLQRLQQRCFEFKFKRGEATIIQLWRHIVPMSQWPSPLSSWWQQAFYGDPPHAALSRSRPVDNMETLMLPDPGEYQQQTSDGKHLSSSKSNIVLDKNFVRNSNLVPCRASVLDAMPCTKFYTLDDKKWPLKHLTLPHQPPKLSSCPISLFLDMRAPGIKFQIQDSYKRWLRVDDEELDSSNSFKWWPWMCVWACSETLGNIILSGSH